MTLKKNTMVFSFGCPRSGTTFIQRMLLEGEGYMYSKIQEGHALHPINSTVGLLEIGYLFSDHRVVFVRSRRDPVKIFESFYHQRKIPDIYPVREPDRNIYMYIAREESSVRMQRPFLTSPIIEIDLDALALGEYRDSKIERLCFHVPLRNEDIFLDFVDDIYMKASVRSGKLSSGATGKRYIDEEKEAQIKVTLNQMLGLK